jgi:PAS domain S-box-containing protein
MLNISHNALPARLICYGIAVGVTVAGLLLRELLTAYVGEGLPTYILFYPPVMFAALLCGLEGGLMATATAALLADYYVLPPHGLFEGTSLVDAVGLALFAGMGMAISVVAELYHRSQHKVVAYEKEHALRESQLHNAFLADVLENAAQPFAVGYPDGRLGLVNRAFEQLTGYRAEELRPLNWTETLTPPEWRVLEQQKLDELHRTGEPVRYEKEYLRKDGTRVPMELLVHLATDTEGKPEYYYSFLSDITERKRVVEALKAVHDRAVKEKNRLDAIMEALPVGVAVLDAQGGNVRSNAEFDKIWGAGRPMVHTVGDYSAFKAWWVETGKQVQPEEWASAQAIRTGKTVVGQLLQIERFDGTPGFVTNSAAPIKDQQGEITGCAVAIMDVTAQILGEQAMRDSEKRMRLAMQAGRMFEFEWDPLTDKVVRAAECGEILGIKEDATHDTGQRFLQRVHPQDQKRFAAIVRGLSPSEDSYRTMYRLIRPDQTVVTMEETARGSFDAEGRLVRVVGMAADVSAREEALEALRQSRDYLEKLFDYTNAPIICWDSDFNITRFNHGFEKLAGYQAQEVVGKNLKILFPEKSWEEALIRIADTLSGEQWEVVEIPIRRKNGDTRTVLWNSANIYADDGETLIATVAQGQDITERTEAERALKHRTRELQQLNVTLDRRVQARTTELEAANKTLRELSSRLLVAQEEERRRIALDIHDRLGSSLSAIKFKAETCVQSTSKTVPPSQPAAVDIIIPMVKDCIEECRRIQMDLRPAMLDDLGLIATFSWFCRRFQTVYAGIGVETEVTVAENEVPEALRTVIFRVVQEAMYNVAQHSGADRIRLSLRKTGDTLELVVEDNGKGCNSKMEPAPESAGKGLGIASMRERVTLSGGWFAIGDREEKGTTVRASWLLHLHGDVPMAIPADDRNGARGEEDMDALSVLVVEDNLSFRETFVRGLQERFPYLVVEETESGLDALEKVKKNPPRLVFMDIRLLGMNGLRAAQKIKSEFPSVKVAMLTSYDVPEYRHAAAALGAERFLVKDQFQWDEVGMLIASLASGGEKKR